jgi:hypothetical protein
MMIEEVPTKTGPGYTEDPYDSPGERAEGMFVGRYIATFTGDPDGFLSTYREWHIFLAAVTTGIRTKTLENIPECPPKWVDEKQYSDTPAMVANIIKCQWPGVSMIGVLSGAYIVLKPIAATHGIVLP